MTTQALHAEGFRRALSRASLSASAAGVLRTPWLWFLLVALAVAGPLLGRGSLLLLDFPSGPRFPQLGLPSVADPAGIGSALPLVALHALLVHVGGPLAGKLFLLAPIVVGGVGAFRLARTRLGVCAPAGFYAGLLYVLNPFVLDRLLAGQLYFLLAAALLVWALGPLFDWIEQPGRRTTGLVALGGAALGAVDLHVAAIYGVCAVLGVPFARARRGRRLALAVSGTVASLLLSAYWLLPALGASTARLPPGDVSLYATRPHGLRSLPTTLALYGFWRNEFPRAAAEEPLLYGLLVPIIGLAAAGAWTLLRRRESRRVGRVLVIGGALGIFGAAASALPGTAGAARWLLVHVPPVALFREPEKLLLLTVVAYALLGAAGLHAATRGRRARALAVVALAVVVGYGHAELWGLSGQVRLARYPPSWRGAARALAARGPGGLTAVVPWQLYTVWSFSGGRIVANPATSFFPGDVVVAADPSTPSPGQDERRVARVLAAPRAPRLAQRLAWADVRFVVVEQEADWWRYGVVARSRDLLRIYRGRGIDVFENRAWSPHAGGSPRSLARFVAGATLSALALLGLLAGLRRPRDERRLSGMPRAEHLGAPRLPATGSSPRL